MIKNTYFNLSISSHTQFRCLCKIDLQPASIIVFLFLFLIDINYSELYLTYLRYFRTSHLKTLTFHLKISCHARGTIWKKKKITVPRNSNSNLHLNSPIWKLESTNHIKCLHLTWCYDMIINAFVGEVQKENRMAKGSKLFWKY